MVKLRADQVTAGFAPGDAISDEARNIRALLEGWQFDSKIFSPPEHIHPFCERECRPVEELSDRRSDLLIYHHSIGSRTARWLSETRSKTLLIYHNITPDHYIRPYNLTIADQLALGRRQLKEILPRFDVCLADSEFNRCELEALGHERTGVLPIVFEAEGRRPTLWSRLRATWLKSRRRTTLFFVGRLVPNKKAEDLVHSFHAYQRLFNADSQLVWVGSAGSMGSYRLRLKKQVETLGLREVYFTGYVSQRELVARYLAGDIFISTSEHEGFCVPVLEAFLYGRPVIALASAAVPETVGDAGLLLPEMDPLIFAAAIDRVRRDSALREALVNRGRMRIQNQFGLERTSRILRRWVEELLA